MRLPMLCLLLLCAIAIRADGCAFGKSFAILQETDQVAVIRLEPQAVTVDMYIAIDGIPKGETITYILPFWHKPEGFTLEEMDGARFHDIVVTPARDQIFLNNSMARHDSAQLTLPIGLFSISLLGPFGLYFAPGIAHERMHQVLSASAILVPYHSISTPNAMADLYHVSESDDLQTLVAQSKLPAKYAKALAKYHTSYFAVMRLTGLNKETMHEISKKGKNNTRSISFPKRGVHYHFRHLMPSGATYTYTYPLGTGAAWPKPIVLTEVYFTCPDAYALQVNAPVLGQRERYDTVAQLARMAVDIDNAKLRDLFTEPPQPGKHARPGTVPVLTASLLSPNSTRPFAWHTMYFSSNPSQDITARMVARPAAWRLSIARLFQLLWFDYLLAALCFLVAWFISLRWVVRPRWILADRPGSLIGHGIRYVLLTAILGWLIPGFFIVSFWVSNMLEQTSGWFIAEATDLGIWVSFFFVFALVFLLLFSIGWLVRNKRALLKRWTVLPIGNYVQAWFVASVLFLLFTGGIYFLVHLMEAAV